jgi:hypothetical protein
LQDCEGKLVSARQSRSWTVHAIRNMVNPDKLSHLGPVSNLARFGSPKELR